MSPQQQQGIEIPVNSKCVINIRFNGSHIIFGSTLTVDEAESLFDKAFGHGMKRAVFPTGDTQITVIIANICFYTVQAFINPNDQKIAAAKVGILDVNGRIVQ
jgi:hypothetical protein